MGAQAQIVVLSLKISADEYLKVYKGSGKNVFAKDVYGRSVQFPARILQSFVTREGISGVFEISFSAEGKYRDIRRLQ